MQLRKVIPVAQISLLSKGLARRCNLQKYKLYPLEDLVRAITKSVCNTISQKDVMVGGNVASEQSEICSGRKGFKGIKEVADVVSSRKRAKDL